jgi:hypothetical protein
MAPVRKILVLSLLLVADASTAGLVNDLNSGKGRHRNGHDCLTIQPLADATTDA